MWFLFYVHRGTIKELGRFVYLSDASREIIAAEHYPSNVKNVCLETYVGPDDTPKTPGWIRSFSHRGERGNYYLQWDDHDGPDPITAAEQRVVRRLVDSMTRGGVPSELIEKVPNWVRHIAGDVVEVCSRESGSDT